MRVVGASLVMLLAVVVATASPARAAIPTCGKLLAPSSGMYFGVVPDFTADPKRLEGDTVTKQANDAFKQESGRNTVWSGFDQHWFEGLAFPRDKVMTVWRAGQIPYVRMEPHAGSPYGQGNPPEQFPGDYSLQNIIDGRFDRQLRAWADAARDTDIPILMEFGIEENADAMPWSGIWNGGGDTTGYGDPALADGPERFRDAYRHLVTLFRAESANNVTWFTHYVLWFHPNRPWESFAAYYPGDAYVDWLGLSVYGEPNLPDGSYWSFEQGLATFHAPDYAGNYADLAAVADKPIALVEVGMPGVPGQSGWIRDMVATLASGRYPRINAIAWFNSADAHTRIDSSPETQQAFHDAVQNPIFDAKPQFSGNCLPLEPAGVKLVGKRLSWRAVPNAVSYEVWRNGRRVASTASTAYTGPRGTYRVRAVNPLGFGPFAAAH